MSAPSLPAWARSISDYYASNAASQFILHGNVHDLMPLEGGLEDLPEFLKTTLLPGFDVIFSYDPGNGLRIERGADIVSKWPAFTETRGELPKAPRAAVDALTRYFRYVANLAALRQRVPQVACLVKSAHLVAPASSGSLNFDLNAIALMIREWSTDPRLTGLPFAIFLLSDSLNDLHPLLAANPRAAKIRVPLPSREDIAALLASQSGKYGEALGAFKDRPDVLAGQLCGLTLGSVESLLKLKTHRREPLTDADVTAIKKSLVEAECQGLVEFIESKRSLADFHGQEAVKAWLREDIALWNSGALDALPMGYLLCGPIGTGKTFLVECLAGEAGIPIVKLKNFRDKWYGTTEGNLETIFRFLHALGRCFVFIDEADQALGKRDAQAADGGLSGRIYTQFAQEMGDPANRGRILWILASSRPDLIEPDLKRPGRIDVKIPIFPTATSPESLALVRALCARRGIALPEDSEPSPALPTLLTPGAAESMVLRVYRALRRDPAAAPADILRTVIAGFQPPVAIEVMNFQIALAVSEASDKSFVPEAFRL